MARHDGFRDPPARDHQDDYDARAYHNLPSVTPRAWGPLPPDEDAFGPPGLGGYGDFREPAHSSERSTRDARGGQRGRGPRSQGRPDASIADDVYLRLTDDDRLDASQVLLSVEDGVVTLTGEVPERAMKHCAEDVASQARGVREVRNRIRVDDGRASFGPPGRAVRSGNDQLGSGFSSSQRTQEAWADASVRPGRAGHENLEPEQRAADRTR